MNTPKIKPRYPLTLSIALALGLVLLLGTALESQAQSENDDMQVCFRSASQVDCLSRPAPEDQNPDLESRLAAALAALVAGPTPAERAGGTWSALPEGTRLERVDLEGMQVSVYLELPDSFLKETFNPLLSDQIVEQVVKTIQPFRTEINAAAGIAPGSMGDRLAIHIWVRDPDSQTRVFRSLSDFLHELPLVRKAEGDGLTTIETNREFPPVDAPGSSPGSLSGKTVYISAGHGWYWHEDWASWMTQRAIWENLIEDFNNAEVVNQYLLAYLRRAGAEVWPVREGDLNTSEYITSVLSPTYTETGTWTTSTYTVTSPFPWSESLRWALVEGTPTASATWVFTPTHNANLSLYTWYTQGGNRAPDAHFQVTHAGGVSDVRIDQTVHGATWRYLGTYPFYGDQPASVTLLNDSSLTDRVVIAGAVRAGGGYGSELGGYYDLSPGTSGKPRWEEASRYWAKYQGAPEGVYASYSMTYGDDYDGSDDVTARPRYAEWEKPAGEDAVFVSWHTNGRDQETRGTESYIYKGNYTPGSDLLQDHLHSTLVADIQQGWDDTWYDGVKWAADFGELRLLDTMPGVLMEIAYHDEPEDTRALLDPRFAEISARAITRGIIRYFADRDQVQPLYPPEAPRGLSIRNSPAGELVLNWLEPETVFGDAPSDYRVYTSPDGFAWDQGVVASTTSYTLTGLAQDQLVFVKVSATNPGGESPPTETLGARAAWDGQAHILLVPAYRRNDGSNDVWQEDGVNIGNSTETGPSLRMYAWRANRGDYSIQHGTAIDLPFDSASRSMLPSAGVLTPTVSLDDYILVDWMAGEESAQEEDIPIGATEIALSSAEQDLLRDYLSAGGSLLISGSEIGLDLVTREYGPAFYTDTLKAFYLGSDAFLGSPQPYLNTVSPTPGGIFEGMGAFSFDNGDGETYYADRVDYFMPSPDDLGTEPALLYLGGVGHAALSWDSGDCARLVYMAFPFETINGVQTRADVMGRILDYLTYCYPQDYRFYLPLVRP